MCCIWIKLWLHLYSSHQPPFLSSPHSVFVKRKWTAQLHWSTSSHMHAEKNTNAHTTLWGRQSGRYIAMDGTTDPLVVLMSFYWLAHLKSLLQLITVSTSFARRTAHRGVGTACTRHPFECQDPWRCRSVSPMDSSYRNNVLNGIRLQDDKVEHENIIVSFASAEICVGFGFLCITSSGAFKNVKA